VKSDITQFIFILLAEVVRMFEYFRCIPDDRASVLLNLMPGMVSLDCLATSGHWYYTFVLYFTPHILIPALSPVCCAISFLCLCGFIHGNSFHFKYNNTAEVTIHSYSYTQCTVLLHNESLSLYVSLHSQNVSLYSLHSLSTCPCTHRTSSLCCPLDLRAR
jgi:hypothetical protein